MKAQSAWTNRAPVQWIQHKMVCPNCGWVRSNSFPTGYSEYDKRLTVQAVQMFQEEKSAAKNAGDSCMPAMRQGRTRIWECTTTSKLTKMDFLMVAKTWTNSVPTI